MYNLVQSVAVPSDIRIVKQECVEFNLNGSVSCFIGNNVHEIPDKQSLYRVLTATDGFRTGFYCVGRLISSHGEYLWLPNICD